jgi:hypothetical protein
MAIRETSIKQHIKLLVVAGLGELTGCRLNKYLVSSLVTTVE